MKNEILIIPDVHGRDFWQLPVRLEQYEQIVFLGDYLDPYPREGISDWACLGCRKPFVLNLESGKISEWERK